MVNQYIFNVLIKNNTKYAQIFHSYVFLLNGLKGLSGVLSLLKNPDFVSFSLAVLCRLDTHSFYAVAY